MVLSPLLFLLYINDLRSVVPETVKVALFAVDVFLTSSHHNKLVAEKELQPVVYHHRSGVATLGRPFPHRATEALPKQSSEGGTIEIHLS